jgi:hypothetical protein
MLCTDELIQSVCEKGVIDSKNDSKYWRKDLCGAWISRSEYGREQSPFGWEIDSVQSQSGKDGQELSNLRPMQWNNNSRKHDGGMVCVLKAVGVKNCQVGLALAK